MSKLEVSNLVKRFGGLVASNDISFSLGTGESLGLIGPNGAGKTTLFSQIMGEHRQDSGSIHLDGQEISRLPTHSRINKGVVRTYQVPRPFSEMTVGENIRIGLMPNSIRQMLGSPADVGREIELALSVGLSEADVHRRPSELPMGNLRKLELARALATGAKLLLLDEVFAGLTKGEIEQITELLNSLRQDDVTYLIVSHDLPALEPLVDRVVAIDRGQIIAQGDFQDVLNDASVRAAYLGDSDLLDNVEAIHS